MASFITNEYLEKIKQYLIEGDIKDSQFEEHIQQ